MSTFSRITNVLACALTLAVSAPGFTHAHSYEAGSLNIGHPWARATPDGAKVGAGYLKITNSGSEADRLVGGTFERAQRFEIHEMKVTGGNMTMRQLPEGLAIPAGETVTLEPGGRHLMFQGLQQRLTENEKVKGTLEFEKAGKVEVEFAVSGIGSKEGSSSAKESHDHHTGH